MEEREIEGEQGRKKTKKEKGRKMEVPKKEPNEGKNKQTNKKAGSEERERNIRR
jgi:hypothetical protein